MSASLTGLCYTFGPTGKIAAVDEAGRYRVVGVRPDGVRGQVDDGLTCERARQVRILLINGNAFPDFEIEAEEPSQ